ncbi:hypothetical protein VN12_09725 [Pirellula sp. SH-Sr6A]|uniref:hypothetical protein n=1 Tax=Pirellula sp. SH-Sr6A TaxID=1632865 RepID=UPI00078D217F|nr:hypothetical protein [Pirellula sp. SH-Sr6A]AMV32392.1 hypothetical protein VN12_09725 [Pirellula sp. SH-Sr6A]
MAFLIVFAWTLLFLLGLFQDSHSSTNGEDIGDAILAMQSRQASVISTFLQHESGRFIQCSRQTIVVNKANSQTLLVESYLASDQSGSYTIKFFPGGDVYVYLQNNSYNAVLNSKAGSRSKPNTWDALHRLPRSPFGLSHFSKVKSNWMIDIQRREMFGMYFSFGGPLFTSRYMEWNQSGEKSESKWNQETKMMEVLFKDWLPDGSDLMMIADESGLIYEMRTRSSQVHSTFKVLEFAYIDSIPVPRKCLIIDVSHDDASRISKATLEWTETPPAKAEVTSDQFFTSYYGVPEPDLQMLPASDESYFERFVVVLSFFAAMLLFIYVYRKSSK